MVEVGQEVVAGDALCVIEVMKMQNVLKAEANGTVTEVLVTAGELVSSDQTLVSFKSTLGGAHLAKPL